MNITIKTIAHKDQRYNTVGDWYVSPGGNWSIFISAMYNWKFELLVGGHELIEMAICRSQGISALEVDRFDAAFEANGKPGEPGDDPSAPYYFAHQVATICERALAAAMQVNWAEYATKVNELTEEWRENERR